MSTGFPRVAILLAAFNGQEFLAEQLDSIARSEGVDWRVWVSDDGSTDETREILGRYGKRWGDRLQLVDGPRQGVRANMFSLVNRREIEADAFAFADQDDLWEPDKLRRAVAWLSEVPSGTPALFCSRTRLVDRAGHERGLSPLFERPSSFANALTQNLASGNTMVFNNATRQLLVETAASGCQSAMHDWWTYLIVTGVGGQVRYDPLPLVWYRQHAGNQVGAHAGALDRVWHAGQWLGASFRTWNDQNCAAVARIADRLTPGNRRRFEAFAAARAAGLAGRLLGMRRSGVYRQTRRGTVIWWTAAVLGRL